MTRRSTGLDYSSVTPAVGQYHVVQFYRFVRGAHGTLGDEVGWDCTSADPANHWVTRVELYCYGDFLRVLAARSASAVVTHPAEVASLVNAIPART